MSCYHPLKAFQIGLNPSGKPKFKICSYAVNHVFKNGDSWFASPDAPVSFNFPIVTDFIEIPCGRCIGCRLEYSRQWANRLMLENSLHDSSYFVTLTYDNEHLPENFFADPSTGLAIPNSTLVKRDVQLFLKRLRKAIEPQHIRFFCAGEYGDKSFRPHYHLIIFGLSLPPDDLSFYKRSSHGDIYYNSRLLSKCWTYGYSVVTQVTWETCAYVARYVCKKYTGAEASLYDNFNCLPPFSLMSRKPGIAKGYYDTHNINLSDEIIIAPGRSALVPKYFEKFIEIDNPDDFLIQKEARKLFSEARKQIKLSQTDLSYEDLLLCEEQSLMNKIKVLRRDKTEEVI